MVHHGSPGGRWMFRFCRCPEFTACSPSENDPLAGSRVYEKHVPSRLVGQCALLVVFSKVMGWYERGAGPCEKKKCFANDCFTRNYNILLRSIYTSGSHVVHFDRFQVLLTLHNISLYSGATASDGVDIFWPT